MTGRSNLIMSTEVSFDSHLYCNYLLGFQLTIQLPKPNIWRVFIVRCTCISVMKSVTNFKTSGKQKICGKSSAVRLFAFCQIFLLVVLAYIVSGSSSLTMMLYSLAYSTNLFGDAAGDLYVHAGSQHKMHHCCLSKK